MKCNYSCKSAEHSMARRGFLGGMLGAAGSASSVVGGLGIFANPAIAKELVSIPMSLRISSPTKRKATIMIPETIDAFSD